MAQDSVTVVVIGAAEVEARLKSLGTRAPMILAQGVYEAAQTIMTDAKEGTPVDTGNLRASGHVMPNTLDEALTNDGVTFQLGFGGPAGAGNQNETNALEVGYAVYVHESGPRAGGVGRRKFLTLAVQENERRVVEIIGKHANREIQRAYGVA